MANSESRNYSIVVHGGAGPDSDFIHKNIEGYKAGLRQAMEAGYAILEKGGKSVDAVHAAVMELENNPLFNAGRGSELNRKGETTMCASIMNGSNLNSGAAAIVRFVKNPCDLARTIMEKSKHIYLGGPAAIDFARENGLELREEKYFITPHATEVYNEMKEKEQEEQSPVKSHGTVGAVACDMHGDVAACTSTGGTEYAHEGRIGDSSMIGVGCYADNRTCAVSGTGDGEHLIQHVIGHHLHSIVEMTKRNVEDAANYLINEKLRDVDGDIGLIAVDASGRIAMEFNSERMHRGWKSSTGEEGAEIY